MVVVSSFERGIMIIIIIIISICILCVLCVLLPHYVLGLQFFLCKFFSRNLVRFIEDTQE